MGEVNGTNKGAPFLPGGNEYTSLLEELKNWDFHTKEGGAEPLGILTLLTSRPIRIRFMHPSLFSQCRPQP